MLQSRVELDLFPIIDPLPVGSVITARLGEVGAFVDLENVAVEINHVEKTFVG